MMKKLGILFVAGMLFLSVGCTATRNEQAEATPEKENTPAVEKSVPSEAVEQFLSRFLKAISEENSKELVDLFTYDMGPYPEDKAKSIIKDYQEKFGKVPLSYSFKGFNDETNMFEYTITGDQVIHTVYMVVGDGGLISIQDPFVPQ